MIDRSVGKRILVIILLGLLAACGGGGGSNGKSQPRSDPVRFVAWADTRAGTPVLTSESVAAAKLSPHFTLYAGDLIDCSAANNPACFADGFGVWQSAINGGGTNDLFDKSFAVRGNHDKNTTDAWQANFEFSAVAAEIGAENYAEQAKDLTYSFDLGNAHFAGVDLPEGDVHTLTNEQIDWLDGDLAAAEGRGLTHAFLFWHGPLYPVDGHPSTPPQTLIAVLNRHPIVSAGFFGHEHLVTHTRIDGLRLPGLTIPLEQFISGAAGANLYNPLTDRYDYWLNDGSGNSAAGFMVVDISGRRFTVSIYRTDGTLDRVLEFDKTAR
jgi:hypothetical protein